MQHPSMLLKFHLHEEVLEHSHQHIFIKRWDFQKIFRRVQYGPNSPPTDPKGKTLSDFSGSRVKQFPVLLKSHLLMLSQGENCRLRR